MPKRYNSIRVVLPPGLTITNKLCPIQLPTALVSGNQLDCGGGILLTGDPFKLNVQTFPIPQDGLGGDLFGTADGTLFGPFTITGP